MPTNVGTVDTVGGIDPPREAAMTMAIETFHLDAAAMKIGREHGKSAGSWVVDGNTSQDRAREIVAGYDVGDSEITDMMPAPLSGEWSDGLTAQAVLDEIAREANEEHRDLDESNELADDLLTTFEDGYAEGYWGEVIRAAKAILPATVRDVLAEADYDPAKSNVVSAGTVHYSSSRHAGLDDMDVLVFSGARVDSRQSDLEPLDIGNFHALDEMWPDMRVASPYCDATYFALDMATDAPEDLMQVIRGLEDYPVIDDEQMSKAEMELGQEHWDSYGRDDARAALIMAIADVLDVDAACDVDLDVVFGDVDVNALLDDRVANGDRYPEYIDPSAFEFHVDDIAADVIADMRAWLIAEANNGQGELFDI